MFTETSWRALCIVDAGSDTGESGMLAYWGSQVFRHKDHTIHGNYMSKGEVS